jgi:hypothetical protein
MSRSGNYNQALVDDPAAAGTNSRYYVYKKGGPSGGGRPVAADHQRPVRLRRPGGEGPGERALGSPTTTSRRTSRARRRSATPPRRSTRAATTPARWATSSSAACSPAPPTTRSASGPRAPAPKATCPTTSRSRATTASTCASPAGKLPPSATSSPSGQLLLLTATAEWRVSAVGDVLTPASINVSPQSYVGASNVPPVVVNNLVLYAAARGGHLRELSYAWQASSFISGDICLMAPHLFDYLTISDMAYSKGPIPVLWCISSSGNLLGMTYVPEQEVAAWHRHDTRPAASSSRARWSPKAARTCCTWSCAARSTAAPSAMSSGCTRAPSRRWPMRSTSTAA